MRFVKKRGFVIVTLAFFFGALAAHWYFAWNTYVQEQTEHNQPIALGDYFNEAMRQTMENWQSEFLQLVWQVAGITYLLYVGSPQSKEGQDRLEAKLDRLIKETLPADYADKIIKEFDTQYPRK